MRNLSKIRMIGWLGLAGGLMGVGAICPGWASDGAPKHENQEMDPNAEQSAAIARGETDIDRWGRSAGPERHAVKKTISTESRKSATVASVGSKATMRTQHAAHASSGTPGTPLRMRPMQPMPMPSPTPSAAQEAQETIALIESADHPLLRGLDIREKYFPLQVNKGAGLKYEAMEGNVSYVDEEQRTKSGQRFDPDELFAASKHWPMGTIAKCTNVDNGRCVTVIIIDRGPYRKGRILDVSEAAGRKLGLIRKGVGSCKVEVVAYPVEKK